MIDSLSAAVTGHQPPTLADMEQRSHELITQAVLHPQHQTVPASGNRRPSLFAEVDPTWTDNRVISARVTAL